MSELTAEQLLEIYDVVFSEVHSEGFKTSEIKALLYDNTYWFLIKPKDNWKQDLTQYLISINYDKSQLDMNPAFSI